MFIVGYIDPGTTGLLAQFAAAGFAGVFLYLRSRFRRKGKADEPTASTDRPKEEQA